MSGMFFTRVDKTFRGWFQAVTAAGQLRTGLTGSSFTVNIVNPLDASSITSQVSESTQRPGLYFFDVPATFITSNGIGDYGISIQIDTLSGAQTAPHVRSAQSDVLHITHEDFDSISGSVWNTNATSFNTSGSFGWEVNQIFTTQSMATVTVPAVVSGVWNANMASFTVPGSFGAGVNEILGDVKFIMSSSFIASGSVTSAAASFQWLATTVTGNVAHQYDGMLLLLKSVLSGNQTRIIDRFMTGTFDVDPPFGFGAPGDAVYVVYTQFFPSYGMIG